ncbi:hypothetical protein [Microvirga pudoricolor]|uniref:hypothetical protein n=1 Tax=Microvirga pudoricolor TaxID=2778729 RepID=UPI00195165A8|nr:hypothetical protein [Microvirga pudoricolor]MBM6592845.1 hypothetical protein [Microvirga pudoricolor]
MLTETDLNAPAVIQYETAGATIDEGQVDWSDGREFASLREALHWAETSEAPAGQEAYIRAASGFVIRPEMLEGLWASLQGP